MSFADLDLELVSRSQRGDAEAFEALCASIGPDLYRFILSILRHSDDADDVYQEVLIRVHRHLRNLRDPGRLPGWARQIAVNQCHTHRARQARKSLASWDGLEELPPIEQTVWIPQGAETPKQAALRAEVGDQINLAIASLPPRQRTCLVLFEIEGNTIREIAESLKCSEGAVKFNLHQARKKMQGSLRGYLDRRPEPEPEPEPELERESAPAASREGAS